MIETLCVQSFNVGHNREINLRLNKKARYMSILKKN